MRAFTISTNAASQARWASGYAARLLRRAIASRGRASLAVPGGDTPGPFLHALSRQRLPWDKVNVTLTDERWLNPRHAQSNERQLRRTLLRHEARRARFFPLKTAAANPTRAARRLAGPYQSVIGALDLCVLGMGGDGHVASLFPTDPAWRRRKQGLIAATAPGARGAAARISLGFSSLARARATLVLIRGAEKRPTLAAHLAAGPDATPIGAVFAARPRRLTVSWSP